MITLVIFEVGKSHFNRKKHTEKNNFDYIKIHFKTCIRPLKQQITGRENIFATYKTKYSLTGFKRNPYDSIKRRNKSKIRPVNFQK